MNPSPAARPRRPPHAPRARRPVGALPALVAVPLAAFGSFAAPAVPALPVIGAAHAAAQEAGGEATPTRLVVRVVSHDAKVIGSGVGGARVVVRDAESGEVLAEGVQEGGTGDTDAIMRPSERGATVFDHPGTAAFATTLPLKRPRQLRIEAEGPLGTPHAVQRASKTVLAVPGVHLDGEGVVLVLNGFTVQLERPGDAVSGTELPVRVRVTMLCGCPIEPGGLWDADGMEVRATLLQDGAAVDDAVLTFAGETSVFEGEIVPPGPGRYGLRVVAVDADRANAGMVTRDVAVGGS